MESAQTLTGTCCTRIAWWLSILVASAGAGLVRGQSVDPERETIEIKFKTDQGEIESIGEIVAEYQDGSLLLLSPDGQLWTILGSDVVERKPSEEKMVPLSSDQIYEQLKGKLAAGFQIHRTKHYLIVYNTSGAYAKWAGELFERLYRGFYNYWDDMDVQEPRFPLVAVVFKDKESYIQFAEREIGKSARMMIGYYDQKTNRMTSYDLTGVSGVGAARSPASNSKMINTILSRPQAERTVATIVHEAVHQLAYNSGLQTRLADNPRWLSEGLAMYFESPDLKNRSGWTMGKVNYHNLRLFAQYVRNRPEDSLLTLISNNDRMMNSRDARSAYPESWALTHFLIKKQRSSYNAYLKELAEGPPLGETSDRERIDLFKKHFGDDLSQLDVQFMRYIRAVR